MQGFKSAGFEFFNVQSTRSKSGLNLNSAVEVNHEPREPREKKGKNQVPQTQIDSPKE